MSKETTVITSPLRKDGYPDFRAALNEINRCGVTRENNAAVLLWQAFGPAEMPERDRTEFLQSLQISSLPTEGAYFVSFDEYARGIRESDKVLSQMRVPVDEDSAGEYLDPEECARRQLADARRRPWSGPEYPAVAEWLKANEKPLALVVAASRRPRMYCPLVSSSLLIAYDVGHVGRVRQAAEALSARATQTLAAGKVEEAWQDLLAIQRLARLIAQGPMLLEKLVALSMQRMACDGTLVLLASTDLTADQARRFQADLRGLPPMSSLAEKLDIGERYVFLDVVCAVSRDPVTPFEIAGVLPQDGGAADQALTRGLTKALIRIADAFLVDWDDALRTGNEWYGRAVAAMRKPTFRERSAEARRIEQEGRQASPSWIRALLFHTAEPVRAPSRRVTFGRLIGELGIALLFPSVSSVVQVEDREAARFTMTQVAIALAAYRAEHGAYPRGLAELRPKYLEDIPKDPFTESEFRYQLRQNGYVLYTVGPNCRDDNGRNWQEELNWDGPAVGKIDNNPIDADDVAIQLPITWQRADSVRRP